ncbi:MAG: SOS response-associated peptidase [Balneola sp.]
MCGRYHLSFKKRLEIDEFLAIVDSGNYRAPGRQGELEFANYNVAPTSLMPVCRVSDEGKRVLDSMYWWLNKWPIKEGDKPNFKYSTFNARDDKLKTSKLWRSLIEDPSKRCIVPMNGYYEFSGGKGNKTPNYFYPTDDHFFGVAGIWSPYSPFKDTKSFAIITTKPNSVQEPIHDRMPVILHPTEFDDWLNPDNSLEYIMEMMKPYPEDAMATHVVSKDVNSTRNKIDAPYLIEPTQLF